MAATTETVFVEFVIQGEEQLETAQDTLLRTGQIDKQAADQFKKTNAELAKRQQVIDGLNKKLRETQAQNAKTIADLEVKLETFIRDFAEGFGEGIVETLQEAGFEFDEFGKIINKNDEIVKKSGKSLKSELRAITQELAAMKLRGEDNTEEYRRLAQRAGEMKDAIGDAGNEVKNFASDTSKIDGLINTVQGVAGVFAIAQGSVGLFGDESEQLNEVMLKVNSSLALLQGLQAVGNVLQKESAALTFLNTTAQQLYNIVIGESIGLMKAFRIALASTGIGLAILAIGAFVVWMQKGSKATKQLTNDYKAFNEYITRNTEALNRVVADGTRTLEENQARAKARGAQQSQLAKEEIADLRSTFQAVFDLEQAQRDRANAAKQTLQQIMVGEKKHNADLEAELQKTVDAYESTVERRKDIANEIRVREIENEKQIQVERLQAIADGIGARLAQARKNSKQELDLAKESARAQAAIEIAEAGENTAKRFLIEAELQKQLRELDLQYARVRQESRIAGVERELIAAQQKSKEINARVSQEEIDLQKRKIAEEARLAVLQEGLTQNQIQLIKEQALADQLQLQKDFNKQANEDAINDLISRNNAQLTQLNLTASERLSIQEDNLIAAAQIEINANKGLADKIKEIRAKLNEDIRELRRASLEKELQYELDITNARTGVLRRANERIAANENKTLKDRIAAINQVASLDIAAINKRDDANKESLRLGLIDQKEYNLRYEQLKDEEAKITEETELKKRELIKKTERDRILLALDTAAQVLAVIQQFGQQQTDAEQQRIEEQRNEIDLLREAGAITEKEALARQKRLDAEEAALKRKQAQRDKSIAIFQAIINTAAAITKALPNLVLAGIAAALGAAQIALIASKPIPKFGKGKKGNYEGPAEIGETGPELWQHNGDMYLAKKSSVVWVGSRDKVFNPKETVAMLEKNNMQPYVIRDADTNKYNSVYQSHIDYDKLGKVISSNLPQVGLNVDAEGFSMYTKNKNSFDKYLDTRRGYGK